jgi:hypothetical protein
MSTAGNDGGDDGGEESAFLITEAKSEGPTSKWLIDSGATCHMAKMRSSFCEYNELQVPGYVVIADGSKVQV